MILAPVTNRVSRSFPRAKLATTGISPRMLSDSLPMTIRNYSKLPIQSIHENLDRGQSFFSTRVRVIVEPRTRFELVTLACLTSLPRQCSRLGRHLPG